MRIVQEFRESELKALLNDFYTFFGSGFEFEEFLKPFLESIGLSEVKVTQKTRDGGVDLTAVKTGLQEINNADSVIYKVQAKRNNPSTTISPEKIDALRGNLGFNEKGLFITTAKVTLDAKEKAVTKDQSKPVFVIDGIDLIRICIEKQIGFAYRPVFSKSALDDFTHKKQESAPPIGDVIATGVDSVEKIITANDIRVHIISVPRSILDKISNNDQKQEMKLVVNDSDTYNVTFCPSRNYLSKVTKLLRRYGLMQDDGTIEEKRAKWVIDANQTIHITLL